MTPAGSFNPWRGAGRTNQTGRVEPDSASFDHGAIENVFGRIPLERRQAQDDIRRETQSQHDVPETTRQKQTQGIQLLDRFNDNVPAEGTHEWFGNELGQRHKSPVEYMI